MNVPERIGGETSDRQPALPDWLLALARSTPARVLAGQSGAAYRTHSHLTLKADHAAARDAVAAELSPEADFGEEFVKRHQLFSLQTQARSKSEYLLRPDLGRKLDVPSRERLVELGDPRSELQIVVGDGLSATAAARQVPALLPRLLDTAKERGWRVGRPFYVRYCRVGVMNDIGQWLAPEVLVLLIGERPGLATAESLSAYMAYRPVPGHTDAQRNLISNIHARGVTVDDACERILVLAEQMRTRKISGVEVKEDLSRIRTIGPC